MDQVLRKIQYAKESKATALDLSSLGLKTLPPEIWELKSLTVLELMYIWLTTLPPEIEQLKSLTSLDLTRNQLKMLPPEIGQLKNLKWLNLSRNLLTKLPSEMRNLKNLKTLVLYDNPLDIPTEILETNSPQIINVWNQYQANEASEITVTFKREVWGQLFPIELAMQAATNLKDRYKIEKRTDQISIIFPSPEWIDETLHVIFTVLAALQSKAPDEVKEVQVKPETGETETLNADNLVFLLLHLIDRFEEVHTALSPGSKAATGLVTSVPFVGKAIGPYFESWLKNKEKLLVAIANHSVICWEHMNLLGEYDFSDHKLKDSVGIQLPKVVDRPTSKNESGRHEPNKMVLVD